MAQLLVMEVLQQATGFTVCLPELTYLVILAWTQSLVVWPLVKRLVAHLVAEENLPPRAVWLQSLVA